MATVLMPTVHLSSSEDLVPNNPNFLNPTLRDIKVRFVKCEPPPSPSHSVHLNPSLDQVYAPMQELNRDRSIKNMQNVGQITEVSMEA